MARPARPMIDIHIENVPPRWGLEIGGGLALL